MTFVEYNALSHMAYSTEHDANSTATAYPFFMNMFTSFFWSLVGFNLTDTSMDFIVAKNEKQPLVAVAFSWTASLIDAAHDL